SNARLGRGDYVVVEADESDRSFLKLSPAIAVVTNIDREHMDSYGSWENLQQAFVDFANKVPFYGAVVACADDPALQGLRSRITRRLITYGLGTDDRDSALDVRAHSMTLEAFGSRCTVEHRLRDGGRVELGELRLRVPGRHNLLNALAAVAVGLEVGITYSRIAAALKQFSGAERRFQLRGEERGVMVVDDYGHHPTEIAAVIAAARAGIDRRVMVVFQPHRYSRTSQLMREFGTALGAADEVILTEIYAAGETPLPGVTVDALAETVRRTATCPVHVVRQLDALPAAVAALARRGDLIVTLGAGSIGAVADRILDAIRTGTHGVSEGSAR
ncbi:MAG: UDP-N-acetylmuramate--L-alanine ligase, partial [Acidobacteria bacterium]|nr:UDP-N-acetylmuramate--L-alanine ligase [Acidobacteriota bacterium]